MKRNAVGVLLLSAVCGLTVSGRASLLVYEGFNYTGTVADGATMAGVTATGTGLTGNYSVTNAGGTPGSTTYSTSGLSFGTNYYTTSGGAVQLNAAGSTTTTNNSSVSTVSLNAGTATGTIYSSYLISFSSLGSIAGGNQTSRLNISGGGANNSYFAASADGTALNTPSTAYDQSAVNGTAPGLTTGTTYLVLSRFTNVGSALGASPGDGVATMWLFTQSAYDSWVAGGALESALSGSAISTASESLTSGGPFTFETGRVIQLTVSGGNNGVAPTAKTFLLDELRWGTSLTDVTVSIPEPSSLLLGASGLVLLCLLRRRSPRS